MREKCIIDGCDNIGAKRGDRIRKKCDKHLRSPDKMKSRVKRFTGTSRYQRHKKDSCESPDCTSRTVHACQLEVDHIDGDRSNNAPENLQTLCANCHRLKTWQNQEYLQKDRRGANVVVVVDLL